LQLSANSPILLPLGQVGLLRPPPPPRLVLGEARHRLDWQI